MSSSTPMNAALSVTPETSRRAALFIPPSANAGDAMKSRSDLIRASRQFELEVVALFEVPANRSGAKEARAKLLTDAAAGAFEVVVVPTMTVLGSVEAVLSLFAAGVVVVSCAESWLNQVSDDGRTLVTSMLTWIVDQERKQRREAIREGQARARGQNQRVGRPPKVIDVVRARELLASGLPMARAAVTLG